MAESRSGPHVRNGHGTLFDATRRFFVKSRATKGFATTGTAIGGRAESGAALSTLAKTLVHCGQNRPALSALSSCRAIGLTMWFNSG
jgi:hypothetical protein